MDKCCPFYQGSSVLGLQTVCMESECVLWCDDKELAGEKGACSLTFLPIISYQLRHLMTEKEKSNAEPKS